MFKFVVLVAFVAAANAAPGLIASPWAGHAIGLAAPLAAPAVSIASGPALGATLLGRTTVNAPETTIVKQQVIVDQPEIRLRAVPQIVQAAPVVQHIQHVAPAIQQVAIPAPAVRTIAAPAIQQVAIQAPAVRTIAAPAVQQIALQAPVWGAPIALQGNTLQHIATPWNGQWAGHSQLIAGIQSQTLLASPTSTLLASPTVLALKK